mmetsp:Transcript_18693/g.33831  ORF Transcript_18693/g.33831 Transcript_18693/m.33831 type:complete len:167 (-) Transcript_18693:215-715(-)|eukprot:CAMPEP_0201868916 /NCGR_PEP_ID=MMETSP0902-20130614/2625_1 /ASSEMBLY_ACC=CAM_ASM_000551 /TAXON_ID=420261 /ORGANISM="Thalassiosira antarctica, Strain CCMP982" /LENGTH=166 /DNA_ID=CAMNT_0048394327 /DNA_START=75 /DNA_END=575 /DNA_ORIENTATION=+
MRASTVLIASFAFATASAFAPATCPCTTSSSALSASRREAFEKFGSAAFSAGIILISGEQPAQAAEEEEFNELINVLKARSDDNKEANANYAMRADKLSSKDFKDVKSRRPKLIIVSTSKGNKIYSKEEFNTLDRDGKIKTEYGTRQRQGGGDMKDYNDITYILTE